MKVGNSVYPADGISRRQLCNVHAFSRGNRPQTAAALFEPFASGDDVSGPAKSKCRGGCCCRPFGSLWVSLGWLRPGWRHLRTVGQYDSRGQSQWLLSHAAAFGCARISASCNGDGGDHPAIPAQLLQRAHLVTMRAVTENPSACCANRTLPPSCRTSCRTIARPSPQLPRPRAGSSFVKGSTAVSRSSGAMPSP